MNDHGKRGRSRPGAGCQQRQLSPYKRPHVASTTRTTTTTFSDIPTNVVRVCIQPHLSADGIDTFFARLSCHEWRDTFAPPVMPSCDDHPYMRPRHQTKRRVPLTYWIAEAGHAGRLDYLLSRGYTFQGQTSIRHSVSQPILRLQHSHNHGHILASIAARPSPGLIDVCTQYIIPQVTSTDDDDCSMPGERREAYSALFIFHAIERKTLTAQLLRQLYKLGWPCHVFVPPNTRKTDAMHEYARILLLRYAIRQGSKDMLKFAFDCIGFTETEARNMHASVMFDVLYDGYTPQQFDAIHYLCGKRNLGYGNELSSLFESVKAARVAEARGLE